MEKDVRRTPRRYGQMEEAINFKVVPSQNGFDVHQTEEIEQGVILDPQEHPVESKRSLVARVDTKFQEPITISKGLAWLIGLIIAVVPIGIAILIYVATGAMGYQTVVGRVNEVEKRADKMETAITELQTLKITTIKMQGDVEQIKQNQASTETDRKKMMSDLADIRILLAQQGLGSK